MERDIIFLSSKNPFKRYFEIRKAIKENNTEIIWSWGGVEAFYGFVLSLVSRVRHINGSVRHGVFSFNRHQLLRLVILHLSANVVANSYAGLKANKLVRGHVLYNGIDGDFYVKPEKNSSVIRKELGIEDENIILTSIANLVPYKDYDTILKALSILKRKGILFHYIAIGEGVEKIRIIELYKNLNLSGDVSFPGSRTNVKDILSVSNIFIHSSRGEGCSNAILEAMSAGLPIIASDTGGTGEVVDETIGRLFDYQNVEQLSEKIQEIIYDKPLRDNLGKNSKKKAINDFSIERMMADYYQILEEVRK
jgi:glycosyltransferase involved in cell wall biosynthesis